MLKANVKRKVVSRFNRAPNTVQEAVGRNGLAPTRLGSALPMAQPVQKLPSTLEISTITNSIRRFDLRVLLDDVPWTDWATTNIDRCLAEHQQKFGIRHPLKTLSLTSDNTTSLPIISCILAVRSLDIQTLTVGNLWRSQESYDIDPVHGASASRFLINLSQEHLRSPWHALKETLVQLDMHTTIIATKDITRTFLRRLQDLPKLRALCVSTRHIHDWVHPSYQAPRFIWKVDSPFAHTFEQSSVVNSTNVNHGGVFAIELPTASYSFAPLREFVIKSYPFGYGEYKEITTEQALFVLAAMPGLEYFVAEDGVIRQEQDVPESTNPVATPCDTVLGIPELHELIINFMNRSSSRLKDLKHCALVCRHWRSYFKPYAWKSLTVGKKVNKGRMSFTKETGILVRRLTITCATRNLVNIIPEIFPHIEYLSLAIESESDGIRYGHLHRLFALLQSTLTDVKISLEMSVVNDPSLPSATKTNNSKSSLRRLHYKEAPSNIVAFENIIATHGPGLEELAIKGHRHYSFSEDVWRSVLETCRFLRILDIVDRGPCPSIPTLVLSLLHLEALLINFLNCSARQVDLGLSELGVSLEKHRNQYGREHPLKCLEFGGWIDRPDLVVKTLMEVLLQDSASSQIKGLRICYGNRYFMTPSMYPSVLASTATSFSSSSPSSTLSTTTGSTTSGGGRSLKDTLVQLDVSFEQFPQYGEGKLFFEKLQEFRHLRVLYVMHSHLWVLDRIHNEKTTLHFPSIQELHIGYGDKRVAFPLHCTPSDAVTLELAVLVVAMMPQLKVFVLADKATGGVMRTLRERFQGIVFEGDYS
ncbi:hypothetical protein EC957_011229 [Mortierella hygrophila]|uniref:Uncharacterized protein n=1 Tax=Mortierella hygrophila TaxID=979708 RepID=A0A9P6F9N3_9FUNG|nr:hypothetical protein EC957_011229 [Mortierella hygrophila]